METRFSIARISSAEDSIGSMFYSIGREQGVQKLLQP